MLIDETGEATLCEAMRRVALEHDLPGDAAAEAVAQLLVASRNAEPLSETIRTEFRVVPDMVEMCYRPGGVSPFSLFAPQAGMDRKGRALQLFARDFGWTVGSTPAATTANLTHLYQQLVAIANQPYDRTSTEGIKRLVPNVRLLAARDPIGLLIARLTTPFYPGIFVHHYTREANVRGTAIIIALRQFERDQHRAPDALQELVPSYLPEIPRDPFDEKPFRYRKGEPDNAIVYSVGPNQLDENGLATERPPRTTKDAGDIVFCECEVRLARERLNRSR